MTKMRFLLENAKGHVGWDTQKHLWFFVFTHGF